VSHCAFYQEIPGMTIEINGEKYYKTSEACKKAGISRATLFRWLKEGILDKYRKDRRGWRIFTEEDLEKLRAGQENRG
jgi:excisionase family DNA binding protein